MSYLVISAKKVIITHRPLINKTTQELHALLQEITVTSEFLLKLSKLKSPSASTILLTQEAISETREELTRSMNELTSRN